MDEESAASVKIKSLLRRAGLRDVPLPAIACAGALCAALVVLALVHFWPGGTAAGDFETTGGGAQAGEAGQVEPSALSSQDAQSDAGAAQSIAVDVEGAVKEPGVYELASDSRVVDAVEAAGGFARNAARTSVNLAEKLEDGRQVYVSSAREMKAAGGGAAGSGAAASGGSGSAASASASGASGSGGKVNINTASAEELQTLSGIGPSLSQAIIDYREENGPFTSIEQLKEVSGIGDARFASIEDAVCV